jgi:hypothetical protein
MSRTEYAALYNQASSCPGTRVSTWADTYKAFAKLFWGTPGYNVDNMSTWRFPNATMTLSATSGSSIMATLSEGKYFGAGTFYIGGWVVTKDGGRAKIVSVKDDKHIVLDTKATQSSFLSSCASFSGSPFGATSYANPNYAVPLAAPADPIGTELARYLSGHALDDYLEIEQSDALLAYQYGSPGGAAAFTGALAISGGVPIINQPYKWQIGLRPK